MLTFSCGIDRERFRLIKLHKLLEPLPDFIEWQEYDINVVRENLLNFTSEDFVAYKEKLGDTAPEWLTKVDDLHVFVRKIRAVDEFIQDVTAMGLIHQMIDDYKSSKNAPPPIQQEVDAVAPPQTTASADDPQPSSAEIAPEESAPSPSNGADTDDVKIDGLFE